MPDDTPIFLIDSDVFMSIKKRPDADALFDGILNLAALGQVKTVRQVFKEMENDPVLKEKILPHKKSLEISISDQYTEDVQKIITALGDEADYLWSQTGGTTSDPADPWLIAVGAVYGYTVVTNENPRSSRRIPAACALPSVKCQCISGPHFLYTTEIVVQFDPAHISPQAFFGG